MPLLEEGEPVLLSPGVAFPIGWAPDASIVFALQPNPPAILGLPADRNLDRIEIPLPFAEVHYLGSLAPDASFAVLSVADPRSDVWMIENLHSYSHHQSSGLGRGDQDSATSTQPRP
jgi:hypothetical protein